MCFYNSGLSVQTAKYFDIIRMCASCFSVWTPKYFYIIRICASSLTVAACQDANFYLLSANSISFTFISTKACTVKLNIIFTHSFLYCSFIHSFIYVTISSKTADSKHYVSSTTKAVHYFSTTIGMRQSILL